MTIINKFIFKLINNNYLKSFIFYNISFNHYRNLNYILFIYKYIRILFILNY